MIDNDNYEMKDEDEISNHTIDEDAIQPQNIKANVVFPYNIAGTKQNNPEYMEDILFRNYIPNDETFIVSRLPYFDLVKEVENNYNKKVRKYIKSFINLEKNPLNIVPKKNNIDLKRNIADKLSKLSRKTEIAILEIIKDNIKKQQIEQSYQDGGVLQRMDMEYNKTMEDLKEVDSDYD